MNKEYLHKVLNHIVSETRIDYDQEKAYPPFTHSLSSSLLSPIFYPHLSFLEHCEEVYGLTEPETEYIWEEYKQIIRDKIENQKG
jgi:hypothetical protein